MAPSPALWKRVLTEEAAIRLCCVTNTLKRMESIRTHLTTPWTEREKGKERKGKEGRADDREVGGGGGMRSWFIIMMHSRPGDGMTCASFDL